MNPWPMWTSLERREKDEYQAARHRLGPRWDLEHHWILRSPFPGWRVQNVRSALDQANHEALRQLAERLAGLDVGVIAQALLATCRDIALVWGGSMLLGAGAGAALGSLAGGVGAVPGALAGAGVGTQVGAWVLGVLGLAELLQDLGDQIPQALRHYARGLELAWGQYSRSWTEEPDVHRAASEIANGHVLLAVAVLSALAAYLTRGRGDPAVRGRILQHMREKPRLGGRMADWVAANEDKLLAHPGLKPKQQQVTMASAPAKDVGPPVTPAQLKRLREEGAPTPPDGPKKPEAPPAPKVMPQKRVRCFEPNDLPKSRYKEFDRQLQGQEGGLNQMTVDEYLKGREAFDSANRDPKIAKQARAAYQKESIEQTARTLRRQGLAPRAAEARAAELVANKMKTLAALHNPDMIAAGKDVIADFGDRNINSRIGAQWKTQGRVEGLDEAARRVPPAERGAVRMNAKLERCP